MKAQTDLFCEGALSLRAILSTNSRTIHELYVLPKPAKPTRHAPKPREIVLELARARGIPITEVDDTFFAEHATGTTHGGLMARVGERTLSTAEELVAQEKPFLAYLCGIEDPYNFASCLRSLYAAGCNGVFLPERNWLSAGSVILRASAGASEYLKLATAPPTDDFLALLEKHGIEPICARQERAENLYKTDLSHPLCLMIGGERRGVDATLDEKIRKGVVIPYGRTYQRSLSAHAACAIISFEILRQQNEEL